MDSYEHSYLDKHERPLWAWIAAIALIASLTFLWVKCHG